MGYAVRESELGIRFEWLVYRRLLPEETSDPQHVYRQLLVELCLLGAAFALVVPSSMVRVLALAPVLADIGDRFLTERARVKLFAGPLITTHYSGTGVQTGLLPNIIVVDNLQTETAAVVS